MIIEYDAEGITNCPMNGIATREECMVCRCFKGLRTYFEGECAYDAVYSEPKLQDLIEAMNV